MKTKIKICLFVLFGVLSWAGYGQDKFGWHFPKRQKFAIIPFELEANLIIIPVKINNSDTLRFILDTGVSPIIMTDPQLAASLHLDRVRNVRIAGMGNEGDLAAYVAIGNAIYFGKSTGYNQNIVIIEKDVLGLSEFVGRKIDGILGYDIFNRFVVTLDFQSKNIILEEPEGYKYKPKKGARLPITIEEGKPYLTDFLVWQNQQSDAKPVKVLIDTGAGHALLLDATPNQSVELPTNRIKAHLGKGLSGSINGYLGRVPKVSIGNYVLQELVASFPDSGSYKLRSVQVSGRRGNIGGELLRRFKVTFNYREGYMVLKPFKPRFKEPFEYNMSGMDLAAKGKDFDDIVIERIFENGPAREAGLEEGDKILFLNNKKIKDTSLSELYRLFQSRVGREITVAVRRKTGEFFVTKFVLRRQI
jgi:predicted aspartyl protease